MSRTNERTPAGGGVSTPYLGQKLCSCDHRVDTNPSPSALDAFASLSERLIDRCARTFARHPPAEAVRLLAGWAFDVLRLDLLEVMIHPDNVGSQRVAERCGFKREGLLRSHMLKQNSGERRDSLAYGLLSHEFRGRDA